MSRGLIVVDVQNDFCEGGSVPVAGGARIATAIADLVEQSAGGDYQYVVATRDHHIDPGSHFSENPDFQDSFPSLRGRERRQRIPPRLRPVVTDGKVDAVFFKGAHSSSKSGFEGADAEGTSLADWLRAAGGGR
ncbi:isochorismatase family protein [Streptomyces sp. M10(2022)]